MRHYILLTAVLILLLPGHYSVQAAETVHPASAPIAADYAISSPSLSTDQTLTIIRVIRNDGPYAVTGIYFSDNLPPAFSINSSSLRYNENPVGYDFYGPFADEIESGYNCYRWITDSPDPGGSPQLILQPGDSLVLTIEINCGTIGDYTLPMHSMTGYGNSAALFAESGPITVTFVEPADVTPPAAIDNLQAGFGTP